ncbi:hypothetical protein, partial [Fangia hongkongensis]|uniref:hypothetical protein n=1 Tax=Fangia hongkongensis TaxID=270495 RepID=UPI0019076186
IKMSERKDQQQVNSLRAKVKKTLKRFVNNKDVSDKEMQIFEKVVSRRQFLGGTFKLSTVAALVGQGIVPSAFAAKRPDLTLPIQEMPILTNELKETITTAAGIKVTSDVIDDILKHKHIESIEAKEYEDTLEALNTVVRAQEGFQNPNQGLEEISKNLQRTYGHPELVRLQNSQFSKDSPYMHNGHELVLYEYNTKQTAPVKKRVIQLPTAFPETLTIKLSNKTGNFELRKGDEIQNKYFRLVYLPDTGNIEIWSKDSDRYCWTLFSGEKHPEAAVLAFQTDGRLAIYSSKGNFIKDLSGMGAETKENVMLEFTSDANLKLYAGKEGCYYDANQAFDVNKNVFEDYMPQDFDYNRIVSINGHKHNTLDNGYVRNQKMILVAKQSVQGSWDGSPGKWLEHTSEMSSCWEQMRLYVQNSRHAVHCPDGMQLKAVYDQGSISDTSGDRWHVYNPLAILQENMIKLLDHQIDPRIPRSGSGYRGFKAKNLRLTIEDIGKFESGNNFACLYGTVKVNLWMNLGFYIFFKEGQEAPVVKFVSLNNKHRYEYLWWSDNNDSDMFWRMAGNKNYRITDSDLNDKNPRVGHALLRRGDTKSFIEQLFRPIGYFNKGQKLLMAYENTHSGDGGEHFARSIAMHFIPTTIDNELYIYDIQDESFLKESHKKFGDKYTEYVCPKERETGIIFNSTVDTYLKHSLFNQNSGLARPIFQFEKYYSTYSNEYYKL